MKHLLVGICLAVAALMGVGGWVPAIAGDAEVHEDADYRFRIRRPAAGWRLLDEREARTIVPDAIAGATDVRGTYLVVIVEEVGEQPLDAMAELLREGLQSAAEEVTLGEVEALTFQGLPARRWESRARVKGVPVQYAHLVTIRGKFAYQLVAWTIQQAREADVERSSLHTLADHFTFVEGEARARAVKQAKHDVVGVGWRVKDGTYQDAVNGVECTPPPGWRLAVGQELRSMNDSACVGLIGGDPEAYVILISEAVRGADPAALTRNLRAGLTETGTAAGAATSLLVGGRAFSMQGYRMAHQVPIRMHHGVRIDGGRAVQVQWWAIESVVERARPRVVEAVKSLRFLDGVEQRVLAAELRTTRDPQEHVGPGHALRAGVYRDFEHGFTWTKPAGFWTLTAGDEARARNEDATLFMEDAATGLQGMVIAETIEGVEAQSLHNLLVERLKPKDKVPDAEVIELEGGTALSTEVRPGTLEMPFRYVVTSVVRGDRATQLLLWGLEGNVDAARPQLASAIRALAFPEPLTAVETGAAAYVDHRMGFRLKRPPGKGWVFTKMTPPQLQSVGTLAAFRRLDGLVMAGAFCALAEEQDDRLLRDLAVQAMRKSAPGDPVETTATVAGLPARRLETTGTSPMVAWIFGRGRTFYMLLVGAPGKLEVPPEEIPGLIELLE
jgi:hypothetical protein